MLQCWDNDIQVISFPGATYNINSWRVMEALDSCYVPVYVAEQFWAIFQDQNPTGPN